jgi:hypothetical protein
VLRRVLAIRRKGADKHEQEQQLIDRYLAALEGTPLGQWADEQERKMERVQ